MTKIIVDPNVPTMVTLRGVRILYAKDLNEARAMQQNDGTMGAPKFGATVLIPDAWLQDAAFVQALQGAMWNALLKNKHIKGDQAAATALWAQMQAQNYLGLKPGAIKAATSQDFLGHHFIAASSDADEPPLLFHKWADPNGSGAPLVLSRPQSVIYSGCYVNIQVNFWMQFNNFGKKINTELKVVQFEADGDRLGGDSVAANTSVFGAAAAPAGMNLGVAPNAAPAFNMPGAPAAPAAAAPGFGAPAAAAPGFGAPAAAAPGFGAPAAAAAPAFSAPPVTGAPF